MKNLMKLTVATAVSLIALAANSHAQVITSIQFTQHPYIGTDLTPSQVAGAPGYAVDNWNVVDPIGANGMVYLSGVAQNYSANSGLITATGGSSSVGYNLTSGGPSSSQPGLTNTADNTLMSSGASTDGAGSTNGWYTSPVTLTLSGLNASDTYAFNVYVEGSNYELGEGSVNLSSGGTQYFTSTLGGFAASPLTALTDNATSTDFSTVDANNPGGAASAYASDYVTFSGITGVTSDTISLTSLGAWPNGVFAGAGTDDPYGASGSYVFSLSGVQVIDTAAVPEPSTWAMMLGGLGMLAFCVRRKGASVK